MATPKEEQETTQLPDPGRLFPVCCAADIPAELNWLKTSPLPKLVDRFIEENQMHGPYAKLSCNFVFVDSLSETYTDETEIGDMEDERNQAVTSPTSPFKGKSPAECHRLLREMRFAGSDVDYTCFVVMDERSLEDDTVLLVNVLDGEGKEGEVRFFRASFEIVDTRLLGYLDGEFFGFERDLEAVRGTEDGVLRI